MCFTDNVSILCISASTDLHPGCVLEISVGYKGQLHVVKLVPNIS